MEAGNLDKLVMLLSTDWFFPYWYTVGIGIAKEKRELFQRTCREIVKQIMSEADVYWNTSFAEARVNATYSSLQAALRECEANKFTNNKVEGLLAGQRVSYADEATAWLILTITEQLVTDSLGEATPLSVELRNVVRESWDRVKRPDPSNMNFAQLSASSASDWDNYIRSTTPDLPTRLSDYLFGIVSQDKFDLFWADVNASLSTNERRKLLNWYCKLAESMTGEPLRLPQAI
jgi:hypothetical protein